MSGGSWDYLCYRIGGQREGVGASELFDAANRLDELGDHDAATIARNAATAMNTLILIEAQLHDMEWIDSGDYLPDQYRPLNPATKP